MADNNSQIVAITTVEQIIKSFDNTVKSLEKIDNKKVKVAFNNFNNIAVYLEKFFSITSDIYSSISIRDDELKKIDASLVKGQESIIKLITESFDFFNKLNEYNFSSLLKFKYKMYLFKSQFIDTLDALFSDNGITSYLEAIDGGGIVKIDGKERKISKIDNYKRLFDNIDDITKSIENSIESLHKTSVLFLKKFIIINLGFKILKNVFNKYIELFESKSFRTIGYKKTRDIFESISDNFDIFNEIFNKILTISDPENITNISVLQYVILPSINHIIDDVLSIGSNININGENKEKFFEGINKILIGIYDVTNTLEKFDMSVLVEVLIARKTLNIVLNTLTDIIVFIDNFANNIIRLISKSEGTEQLKDYIIPIIDSLLSVVRGVILLALSFPIILLAGPLAIGTVAMLSLFIKTTMILYDWVLNTEVFTNIKDAAKNLTIIIALIVWSMIVAAAGVVTLAIIGVKMIDVIIPALQTMVMMSAILVGISLLALLINKILNSKIELQIISGLLSMVAIIGVMLIVSGSLILLGLIGKVFFASDYVWQSLKMFGFVSLLTLAIAGVGYLLSLLLPGIIAFTAGISLVVISITTIILIAAELLLLAQIKFDETTRNTIKENVSLVMKTALDVISSVFNGITEDEDGLHTNEESHSGFYRLFRSIFKGAATFIEALMSSLTLVMTFVSVTMILMIAGELSLLAKIDVNELANGVSNVEYVLGVANAIIGMICKKPDQNTGETDGKKKKTFGDIIKGIGNSIGGIFNGIVNVIDSILSFGYVAFILASIAIITLIAKNIEYLAKLEFNSEDALSHVKTVLATADLIVASVNKSEITRKDIKNAELTKKFMKVIKETVNYMTDIGEYNKSGEFDNAIDSYVKFVDKINTVKLENLQTATNMFEKMAQFSESINGNFEGLAETINDKIMPVLEELNEALGKTNEHIENGGFKSSPVTTEAGGETPVLSAGQTRDYSQLIKQVGANVGDVIRKIEDINKVLSTNGIKIAEMP